MTEPPTPDPYRPEWIGGPGRAEDEAYLFAKLRELQEEQIRNRHGLLVARSERDRALELASIVVLTAAADGADVRSQIDRLFDLEGERVLIETAVRLVRLLGADHGYEIGELLDAMRRLAEGKVSAGSSSEPATPWSYSTRDARKSWDAI